MARIRTVKPELFKHEDLYDLELETGLPIRVAWIGLFTVADREGRFKWRPREMKVDILPYDQDVDFSHILDALEAAGFVARYEFGGEVFGVIPKFLRHQVINAREAKSKLPEPPAEILVSEKPRSRHIPAHVKRIVIARARMCVHCGATDDLTIDHIHPFSRGGDHSLENLQILCRSCNCAKSDSTCNYTETHVHARGEGKGKEGKRKGTGREGVRVAADAAPAPAEKDLNGQIWAAYREEYSNRYKVEPIRNPKVNSQIDQLAKRLGQDAPHVVRFFVNHPKTFYVSKLHEIGVCLSDAESLRTQWARGRAVTNSELKRFERAVENHELDRLIDEGKI
jgi:5-methylcytosine-specific restriction endonuclease McrA